MILTHGMSVYINRVYIIYVSMLTINISLLQNICIRLLHLITSVVFCFFVWGVGKYKRRALANNTHRGLVAMVFTHNGPFLSKSWIFFFKYNWISQWADRVFLTSWNFVLIFVVIAAAVFIHIYNELIYIHVRNILKQVPHAVYACTQLQPTFINYRKKLSRITNLCAMWVLFLWILSFFLLTYALYTVWVL